MNAAELWPGLDQARSTGLGAHAERRWKRVEVDPVSLQVIGGALHSIAREMAELLVRMAYSSVMRESRDIGAALLDFDGRQLCESDSTPIALRFAARLRARHRPQAPRALPAGRRLSPQPSVSRRLAQPRLRRAAAAVRGRRARRFRRLHRPHGGHRRRRSGFLRGRPGLLRRGPDPRRGEAARRRRAARGPLVADHGQRAHARGQRRRPRGDDRLLPPGRAALRRAHRAARPGPRDERGRAVDELCGAAVARAHRAVARRRVSCARRLAGGTTASTSASR